MLNRAVDILAVLTTATLAATGAAYALTALGVSAWVLAPYPPMLLLLAARSRRHGWRSDARLLLALGVLLSPFVLVGLVAPGALLWAAILLLCYGQYMAREPQRRAVVDVYRRTFV